MNKKSILLGILILLGIGTLAIYGIYGRRDNTSSSQEKRLISEKKITHGHGLAVDVGDPNTLYIATHHGLLVLKNDTELYRIGRLRDDYMGFTVHPDNSQIFYTSGHPQRGGNLGFQKSEDGGGGFTWQKISDGLIGPVDFHVMAVSPADPQLVYGWFQGTLQRSFDEGTTWQALNPQIPEPIAFVPHPQDSNILYAVTIYGISVSLDRGESWDDAFAALAGAQVTALAIRPQGSQTMFAFSRKLGLQKTTDGGITWKGVPENFNNEIVLFIAPSKTSPNILYILTHENSIYKSSNNGETWTKIK